MKVIIEAIITADVWRLAGPVVLRIYARQSFITADGQWVPQGIPGNSKTAWLEVPCTIDAEALVIPGIEIDSTVDAITNPWATYDAELVAGGRRVSFLTNFAVNTLEEGDPSTTWGEIILLRDMLVPQSIPESLPRQLTGMVSLAVGDLNRASSTNTGITALTTDPVDPSFPIAVGANDPTWLAMISSISGSPFNIKDFGAVGNGITDDTAAIAATIAVMAVAGGGTVYFPAGTYLTSGGFNIAVPCHLMGDISGSAPSATQFGSKINCTSRTANLFNITADSATFSGLYLFNTNSQYGGSAPATPPTAGAGIKCTALSSSQKVDINSCVVEGFFNNVVQDGAHWSIHASHLINPVNTALTITNTITADLGDWSISNSTFISKTYLTPVMVKITNAGGGKIVNCKWNAYDDPGIAGVTGYTVGIEVTYTATVILLLSNLSIENFKGSAIVAVGCSLLAFSNLETGDFSGATDSAIKFNNCSDVVLANITMRSLTAASLPAIKCENNCAHINHSGIVPIGYAYPIQFVAPYTGTYGSLTLLNGWVNSSGLDPTLTPAGYTLTNGRVSLRGTVTGGSSTTIATLPVGFRPGLDMIFPGVANGAFQLLRIVAATGAIVQVGGGPTNHQSLDSVTFDLN